MKCLSEMVHMEIPLCGIYSNDFTVTSKQTKLLLDCVGTVYVHHC